MWLRFLCYWPCVLDINEIKSVRADRGESKGVWGDIAYTLPSIRQNFKPIRKFEL